MHRFSLCLLVIPSLLLCALSSCDVSSMLDDQPLYAYDTTAVVREMKRCSAADSTHMYADKYLADLLFADSSFLWIGPDGVNREADALLQRLRQTEAEGVSPTLFHTTQLLADVDSLRARALEDATCDTVDQLAAHVEWGLTQAMLRYAYGQRYGYTDPHQLFNHLFFDEDHYQRLFDIPCDQPTDSLARLLCQRVREERLSKLLDEQQPTGRLFQQLKEAYAQALRDSSHTRARLCIINMERARWRYPRPESGTHVWVNLAGSQLTATDTERDTLISMRVCCGSPAHKSPLLMSNIRLLELNPYWVVPTSIIRKEVAPRHVGDSAYFARNNYHAIDKQTQEQVSPRYLTEDQWLSGRYTLRQEKGAGNSLGRMIFRFPNKFAVYLHDTNSPGAFSRANRAVSHGCIRLQRPLDLALFLLGDDTSEWTIDRIRMAIDLPPLTERGRQFLEENPDFEPLHSLSFRRPVPLWIDYYTLYPDADGTLREHPDTYGYDQVIADALTW